MGTGVYGNIFLERGRQTIDWLFFFLAMSSRFSFVLFSGVTRFLGHRYVDTHEVVRQALLQLDTRRNICANRIILGGAKQVEQRLLDLWNSLELANDRVMHALLRVNHYGSA